MKTYLLLGKTGVGKSSFINSTFGKAVAATDAYSSCTKVVDFYPDSTKYGDICLIDAPGLAEDEGQYDDEYLKLVAERISNISLEAVLYITPLNAYRFRAEDMETLNKISRGLGHAIWFNSWLVLTFAASVPDERRNLAASELHADIHNYLSKVASPSGAIKPFRGFREVLLVDNQVEGWSSECSPTSFFLA